VHNVCLVLVEVELPRPTILITLGRFVEGTKRNFVFMSEHRWLEALFGSSPVRVILTPGGSFDCRWVQISSQDRWDLARRWLGPMRQFGGGLRVATKVRLHLH
jgi:hypothetical protein